MRVKLDQGAVAPKRAHETDAGLDLMSRDTQIIPAHGSAVFDTGVHVELPPCTCGLLVSRSGLNVLNDITSTGLIDEGYTGAIKLKLYNHGDHDYIVQYGDRISQLVVLPVEYETVELTDEDFVESDRGDSGYGSTGR